MSVVAFPMREHPTANQPKKDLYEVGEIPPLGHVPKNMYAWVIRRDRHGPPEPAVGPPVDAPECALAEHLVDLVAFVEGASGEVGGAWHD